MDIIEMENRIKQLRDEIDGLSQWGAGVSIRWEEIQSLTRRIEWAKQRAREEENKKTAAPAVDETATSQT